ncbi:hypothetical protein CEXT_235271 [Caerostris extrusa]|uniref:Uncharacterized protein n=1 Tax=Caerostris extrusa TaxID=172846 RepID=A0AAV4Y5L8_CAEEX|nr:hypothetical protein CEXT_235271 [Caerostris extrusa]
MALVDGHLQKTEIFTTTLDIDVKGKVIPTKLYSLKSQGKPNSLRSRFFECCRNRSGSFRKDNGICEELLTNNLILLQLLQALSLFW